MSKLDKFTFYSNLEHLFDSIQPKDVPGCINEAIQFITCNLEWYNEEDGEGSADLEYGCEMLEKVRQAFEDSMKKEPTWSFYICHDKKGYQINVAPFHELLEENYDFYTVLDILGDTWNVLINQKNIKKYRRSQRILSILKHTFNPKAIS